MKKSHSAQIILAVIWISLSAAAVEGCGWRKVDKEERINFNWDSHILEVTTEEISGLIKDDKQLEIVFETKKQTGEVVLKIWNFSLTQSNFDGVQTEAIQFEIMFHEENQHCWTNKLLGELRLILKKNNVLNMMQVGLAGTSLHEHFSMTNEDRTEMFKFGSGDNISLLYRVNSTVGNENCVEEGSSNSRDTI